jgi:shikimate dehydrogenase
VARRIGGQRTRAVPLIKALDTEGFDLVVNTTSLGLEPTDPAPFDLTRLGRVGAALDLVYGREKTPFVRSAEALGVRSMDGTEMLVQQGAASFERWWGRPAPIEAMRAAIRGALPR